MNQRGLIFGFLAYLLWGFFPLYFKAIDTVPALQILAHRFVWSFVLLVIVNLIRREWGQISLLVRQKKIVGVYIIAGSLLAVNWGVYVWGVNSGHVVDASLGYFINPLLNVLLGVLFLRERLRWSQWVPVGLAAVGVLYMTLQYHKVPWIGLSLAFTFGLYGLVKKIAPLNSLQGLTMETMALFLPAMAYLLLVNSRGEGMFAHSTLAVNVLLGFTGVITVIPLLLFGTAVRLIPLWMLGLLQYIAPTCQFLLGVLVYHEPFDQVRVVGFVLIWLALLLFSLESVYTNRQAVVVYK
ncbi:MAG: EamA family transporter RarD [Chloroflexota bacterium]